jgi:hypothetical protein
MRLGLGRVVGAVGLPDRKPARAENESSEGRLLFVIRCTLDGNRHTKGQRLLTLSDVAVPILPALERRQRARLNAALMTLAQGEEHVPDRVVPECRVAGVERPGFLHGCFEQSGKGGVIL